MEIKIVGIGGSLAEHSNSLSALEVALQGAADAGADIELLSVKELDLPMFQPGLSPPPAAALAFVQKVHAAHGLIWSSPLYHGTISGSFKNALDWLQLLSDAKPAYLTDKVVGLISTAGGTHGLQAVNTMEYVVRSLRGWAVPLVVPISQAWKQFDSEGDPIDDQTAAQLRALGAEVVRAAEHFACGEPETPEAAMAEAKTEPHSEEEALSVER